MDGPTAVFERGRMPGKQTHQQKAAKPLRPNKRRVEKVEATRQNLFDAALKVVGESGYAGSSIAKIAARANVAQGTFYSYFVSQQDVFDQLLPYLGNRLLNEIREKLKDCKDPYEREAIGFQAYFDFLSKNPEFERILSEAAVFTPHGFKAHVKNIVDGYMRAFRHPSSRAVLPHYSERELEAVTYILLGARAYLSQRFMAGGNGARKLPNWAFTAYMKFLRYGLTGPRRIRTAGPGVSPTESADSAGADEIQLVSIDASSATLETEFDPSRTDLAAVVSALSLAAARAIVGDNANRLAIVNFSSNFLETLSPRGTLRAIAKIEGREGGSRLISVSIQAAKESVIANASILLELRRPANERV
jgi:AcrR family transcriptional regulator